MAPTEAPPAPAAKVHLVVCCHGFLGGPDNLRNLVKALNEAAEPDVVVHNSNANGNFVMGTTLDGVDVSGDHLLNEIEAKLTELDNVDRFSIIGYSMGGLMARYVVGRLYERGHFARIQPMNFITIATPHLGIVRPSESVFNAVYNYFATFIVSHAGEQMALADKYRDGKPLLQIMATPGTSFHAGLALFKRRAVYSNVIDDRTVPYCTASIRKHNIYRQIPRSQLVFPDPQYPSILRPAPELEGGNDGAATDVVDDLAQATEAAAKAGPGANLLDDAAQTESSDALASAAPAGATSAVAASVTEAPAQSSSVLRSLGLGAAAVAAIPLAMIWVFAVVPTGLVVLNIQSRWRASRHRTKSGDLAAVETGSPSAMAVTTESSLALTAEATAALNKIASVRDEMRTSLHKLGWERIDAYLEGFLNTHGAIIYRPNGLGRFMTRRRPVTDVNEHVAAHLLSHL